MKYITCCICGTKYQVSTVETKYLYDGEDFACGPDCTIEWLIYGREQRVNPLSLNGSSVGGGGRKCGPVSLGRADKHYSPITHRYYRSEFERNFAEVMHSRRMRFSYEHLAFTWADDGATKFYSPDFYSSTHRAFVEIKGRWGAGQKKKFKSFREHFPEVSILLVPWVVEDQFRELAQLAYKRLPPLV